MTAKKKHNKTHIGQAFPYLPDSYKRAYQRYFQLFMDFSCTVHTLFHCGPNLKLTLSETSGLVLCLHICQRRLFWIQFLLNRQERERLYPFFHLSKGADAIFSYRSNDQLCADELSLRITILFNHQTVTWLILTTRIHVYPCMFFNKLSRLHTHRLNNSLSPPHVQHGRHPFLASVIPHARLKLSRRCHR